jgi:hypothetical protein
MNAFWPDPQDSDCTPDALPYIQVSDGMPFDMPFLQGFDYMHSHTLCIVLRSQSDESDFCKILLPL